MSWRDYVGSHFRELIEIWRDEMKEFVEDPNNSEVKKVDREQSGTLLGYEPQYRDNDGKWKPIPLNHNYTGQGGTVIGIPFPMLFGGILQTIWLSGEAQAQTLAWGYAADKEAVGFCPDVRIVPYEVRYSISATKKEPPTT